MILQLAWLGKSLCTMGAAERFTCFRFHCFWNTVINRKIQCKHSFWTTPNRKPRGYCKIDFFAFLISTYEFRQRGWYWYAVPNLQIYLLICSAHQGDSHRQRWQAVAWPGGYLSPQSPWRPYEEVAYEECCPWPHRGRVPPRGPNTDRSVDGGSVSTRLIQQGKVHQEDSSRWLQVYSNF